MKFKNCKSLKIALVVFSLGFMFESVKADTLTYSDSVNQVVFANGNSIPFTDSENYTQLSVKLGWFSDGFTPTLNNFSSWETNFNPLVVDAISGYSGKGALGYAISSVASTALTAPSISAQIGSGANNTGGSSAATMPAGKLLWLIGSSVANATANSSGSIYSSNPATEFFAATGGLADTTWVIPSITSEGGTTDFSLSVINSSSDVIVGTYLSGNKIQMAVIPEPSTAYLIILGAGALFSSRRRKSLK